MSTEGIDAQRRNLIEALDMLATARPGLRAKFALIVEARRAGLGLTWDQLIISAGAFYPSKPTDQEPVS